MVIYCTLSYISSQYLSAVTFSRILYDTACIVYTPSDKPNKIMHRQTTKKFFSSSYRCCLYKIGMFNRIVCVCVSLFYRKPLFLWLIPNKSKPEKNPINRTHWTFRAVTNIIELSLFLPVSTYYCCYSITIALCNLLRFSPFFISLTSLLDNDRVHYVKPRPYVVIKGPCFDVTNKILGRRVVCYEWGNYTGTRPLIITFSNI